MFPRDIAKITLKKCVYMSLHPVNLLEQKIPKCLSLAGEEISVGKGCVGSLNSPAATLDTHINLVCSLPN